MASRPGFKVANQVTARNPVARAVAKAKQEKVVRAFSIRLHMLEDGEEVCEDAQAAAHIIMVSSEILVARDQGDSILARIMAGGISALTQLSERKFLWRRVDAVAIEVALQRAFEVSKGATPQEVQRAWAYLENLYQRNRS